MNQTFTQRQAEENTRERRCEDLAIKLHTGQTRKYSGDPYVMHPLIVAAIIKNLFTFDETDPPYITGKYHDMICAALLHDTLEDAVQPEEVTRQQILEVGGPDVLQIVEQLTNPSKKTPHLNRAERKKLDREHIINASYEAHCIKAADRIHNLLSLGNDNDFNLLYVEESQLLADVLNCHPVLKMTLLNDIATIQAKLRLYDFINNADCSLYRDYARFIKESTGVEI